MASFLKRFWTLFKTNLLRVLFLLFAFITTFTSVSSQEILNGELVGWGPDISELPSFLFLYKEVDALTNTVEFVDVLTVDVNGNFSFVSPESRTEVYEFEAPPWSWRVLVRPGAVELDTLKLLKSSSGPTRVRGVMAKSVWHSEGVSEMHPSIKYDSLRMLASTLDALVLFDRMAQSGAVGSSAKLVDVQYMDSINSIFEDACSKLLLDEDIQESIFYRDLIKSRIWQWRSDSGMSKGEMRKVWYEEESRDAARSMSDKITSPGWCASWVEVNASWFVEADEDGELKSWVEGGNTDSIAMFIGGGVSEMELAMWWWNRAKPNSTASLWIQKNGLAELSILNRDVVEKVWYSSDLLSKTWTNPSIDLVPLDELYGKWSVLLIVKSGSFSCIREWEALHAVEELMKNGRLDFRFIAVSIDGTQSKWEDLISQRSSSNQTLRWVGADPRWMDGLAISSVPQVVVLSPELEVYSYSAPIPSRGLGKYLQKIK